MNQEYRRGVGIWFALIALALIILLWLSAGGVDSAPVFTPTPVPTATPEPTGTPAPTPVRIDHVLPAPDVYLGLEVDADLQNKRGIRYALDPARVPEGALIQYCNLLEEKYGLRRREKWINNGLGMALYLLDDANEACVEIYKYANQCRIDFGTYCMTAALEVCEDPRLDLGSFFPTPTPEPTPTSTPDPEKIRHILPAPDVFMGLEVKTQLQNTPGAQYVLNDCSTAETFLYMELLKSKYHLSIGAIKEDKYPGGNSTTMVLTDSDGRECVRIERSFEIAGPHMFSTTLTFGEHCVTAALDVMRDPGTGMIISLPTASPAPAETPLPTETPDPDGVMHVLPAPDVFMGLTEVSEYHQNRPGTAYGLKLVNYPAAAVDAYCELLEESYGLRKAGRSDGLGSVFVDDANLRECVKITWIEHRAGNKLLFEFGEHCETAALEVMEKPIGIHEETAEDWETCSVCEGTGDCPECHGRRYIEKAFYEGESIRYDCERCDRGECPNDCVNGRVYKHLREEKDPFEEFVLPEL